jgi:hypothetical protein
VGNVGFLLNLSFPADARHIVALHDVVVQAVRQAGGDEDRARGLAEKATALLRESTNGQPDIDRMTAVVELGPPIQVIVGGRTLTLDNPASASAPGATADKKAGHHDPT